MYNIIIAGNSLKTAELIMSCLENQGYSITTSDSGSNVLAKSRLFNPDLVICHIELTDMSGYDLCKTIKRNGSTADCLVLLINNTVSRESNLKALQSGADDFIDNTFDSLILQAKVKSLLRVKSLSNQLKEKYSELEEKNKIMDMQMEMSRQIQTSLIQKEDMRMGEIKVTNRYLPAIAIGGDFYDIIQIDDNCLAIVIGDVSGHGISSALLTTMLMIMSRNLSNYYEKPHELLRILNNQFIDVFSEGGTDIYICVFAAFIDTKRHTICYANAGLTPPIYASYGDKTANELNISGIPIGLMKDSRYTCKELVYSKNDLLLFHTDGLSDTFYKDDPEKFTDIITILLEYALDVSDSQQIVDMITDEFYNNNASESEKFSMDDVSLILCQL